LEACSKNLAFTPIFDFTGEKKDPVKAVYLETLGKG